MLIACNQFRRSQSPAVVSVRGHRRGRRLACTRRARDTSKPEANNANERSRIYRSKNPELSVLTHCNRERSSIQDLWYHFYHQPTTFTLALDHDQHVFFFSRTCAKHGYGYFWTINARKGDYTTRFYTCWTRPERLRSCASSTVDPRTGTYTRIQKCYRGTRSTLRDRDDRALHCDPAHK